MVGWVGFGKTAIGCLVDLKSFCCLSSLKACRVVEWLGLGCLNVRTPAQNEEFKDARQRKKCLTMQEKDV